MDHSLWEWTLQQSCTGDWTQSVLDVMTCWGQASHIWKYYQADRWCHRGRLSPSSYPQLCLGRMTGALVVLQICNVLNKLHRILKLGTWNLRPNKFFKLRHMNRKFLSQRMHDSRVPSHCGSKRAPPSGDWTGKGNHCGFGSSSLTGPLSSTAHG